MLFTLLSLLLTVARAETLELVSVEYRPAPQSVSCGLLHQRELERQKVIREFEHLLRRGAHGQSKSVLLTNNLVTNKLFMPAETWIDLSSDVVLTAKLPARLIEELESGVSPFLSIDGPGFIWESRTNQLPEELNIEFDRPAGVVRIIYKIYLNVLCAKLSDFPEVKWEPYVPVNGFSKNPY